MTQYLKYEAVECKPDNSYPFFVTAKRYWVDELAKHVDHPNALTLILLHSTSFHKETWEPTLETLFRLVSSPLRSNHASIREAWVIECPNHGASAVHNEGILMLPGYKKSCA